MIDINELPIRLKSLYETSIDGLRARKLLFSYRAASRWKRRKKRKGGRGPRQAGFLGGLVVLMLHSLINTRMKFGKVCKILNLRYYYAKEIKLIPLCCCMILMHVCTSDTGKSYRGHYLPICYPIGDIRVNRHPRPTHWSVPLSS